MDSSALLAHIVSQTKQNVEFLIAQGCISPSDGRDIIAKIGNGQLISDSFSNLAISPPRSASPPRNPPAPSPGFLRPSSPPHPRLAKAQALWDYNEQGQDPNDLSFRAGDIIDIVTETNADWWMGRHNGKEALFPSSYVKKLDTPPPSSAYPAPSPLISPIYEKSNANQFPPAPAPQYGYQPSHGYQGPPPPMNNQGPPFNNGYVAPPPSNASWGPPPGPPQNAPPAEEPQPPPKKSRFGGKLGNTLAQSAVGGVGFGAGSAVGSGIINAIF